MTLGSSVDLCVKSALRLKGYFQPLSSNMCTVKSHGKSGPCYPYFKTKNMGTNHGCLFVHATSSGLAIRSKRLRGGGTGVYFSTTMISGKGPQQKRIGISVACQNMHMRCSVPKQKTHPETNSSAGPTTWLGGYASTSLILGLVCCLSESGRTEAALERNEYGRGHSEQYTKHSHGKKVYTDYSIIGIPGDGRCLFRSVAHGACLRSGKPAPSESLQREIADDLRAKVADEFVKRRTETEWFVEGDFDTYVSQIRKPHIWGGEPELFMASHVLQMPITVYMHDEDAGGLIAIAEYGLEYGNENPIKVLYHGFGHYDALEIPGKKKSLNSRL